MAFYFASLIGRALKRRRQRDFARDEGGATLIEFGLLALPFFSIMGAILETALVFLAGQVLESAVQDASRLIRTGQNLQEGVTTTAAFREQVCNRTYGLFRNCEADLFVEVDDIDNFTIASIQAPIDPDCVTECPEWSRSQGYINGQGSSIMVVQVYYKWPVILDFFNFTLANQPGGKRLMGASAVFRNEPFNT